MTTVRKKMDRERSTLANLTLLTPCEASAMANNTRLIVFLVALAIVFNLAILVAVLVGGNVALYEEGGFVEDISFFCFLCGATILYASAFYRRAYDRHLTVLFGTACLMFFLREVDVGEMNIPQPIKFVTSEDPKDILMTIVFLLLGVHFLRFYRSKLSSAGKLFKTTVARLTLIGCGFFLVAAAFEQLEKIFAEELLETNAAFFILLAALIHVLDPKNLTSGQDSE